MDLLPVGFMLGSMLGVCVAQHENYCPSPPVPTNTSQQELPYVKSEMENEWCFYDPSKTARGLFCRVGRHCNAVGPSCLPCPHHENGIKTYQPQKNNCPKCILCRDCEMEGMEEVSRCTIENNAVCQKRSSSEPTDMYSTTESEEEDTHPPSKAPPSKAPVSFTAKSTVQGDTDEKDDADEIKAELEKIKKQNTLLKWVASFAITLLVITLSGYIIYKLIKHCQSSSTGGEQDPNQNSGPSNNPGETTALTSDGDVILEPIPETTNASSIQNNSETIDENDNEDNE